MRWFWELLFWRRAAEFTLPDNNTTVKFNVFSGDGPGFQARLGDETLEWCKANLKRPHGIQIRLVPGRGPLEPLDDEITMWFIDVREATLFKMFWV